MITVEQAQALCLDLVQNANSENVPLDQALGRTLAVPVQANRCLLYTSPSPRDKRQSRMPSSA